jgi:nucleotide-binding universal stress UspA family protein
MATEPPTLSGKRCSVRHEGNCEVDDLEIVVGVDGSPQANTAVRWAATHAQHTGARLRLLHAYVLPAPAPAMPLTAAGSSAAVADDYLATTGEAVLSAAADLAHLHATGVDVTTELSIGAAAPALVDASADAGLIVVGSRGRGRFTGTVLGSVSTHVSAHAHCPTMVVREPALTAGPVVVGVDDSEPARAALTFAFAEAHRLGTTVVAVHAWSPPLPTGPAEATAAALADDSGRTRYRHAAQNTLTNALTAGREQYPDVRVDERLTEAGPVGALLEAATDPSMIVIGSHGRGTFTGLLRGSTSQSVLHHATCPVAVTRTRRAAPPHR